MDAIFYAIYPSCSIKEGFCEKLAKIGGRRFKKDFQKLKFLGVGDIREIKVDKLQPMVLFAKLPETPSTEVRQTNN